MSMSSTVTVRSICPNYREKQRNGSLCMWWEQTKQNTRRQKKRYQTFLENAQLFVRSIQVEISKVLKEYQLCLLEGVLSGYFQNPVLGWRNAEK